MEINLKWISLFILVFQNCLSVFVMRYSKTLPDKYLSSTAVVCSECVKFALSAIIHIICRKREVSPEHYSFKMLMDELFGKESDCIKIMFPAVFYLIQNNLQYYSASKLDAATFQVTYQMKLIITAIFSVIILKRKLFRHQWISIVLLALGIALVQLPTGDKSTANMDEKEALMDKALGLLSVFIACLCSGFAGVYFEKILKKSKVTLWARNVQLSLFSMIPGFLIGCLLIDGATIKERGFFGGYSRWTVLTILCQAVGGIVVAIAVKYADNILKGFANSISIILSCIISYFFFNFNITVFFIIGCVIVLYSTFLYGKPVKNTQNEQEVEYIKLDEHQANSPNSLKSPNSPNSPSTSESQMKPNEVRLSISDEITILDGDESPSILPDDFTEETNRMEEEQQFNNNNNSQNTLQENQNNNNSQV